MIIQKTIKIDGVDFIKTYSNQHKMIERDGVTYTEAIDPADTNRVYTETNIDAPIPQEETERENKRNELKKIRDEKEMEPILYDGSYFDFDEKSYDRILAAIFALDGTENTIAWTTADNQTVVVTANDLRNVIRAAAVRSNLLHITYRTLADQIDEAISVEQINAVQWPATI